MAPLAGTIQHSSPVNDGFYCNECGNIVYPKFALNFTSADLIKGPDAVPKPIIISRNPPQMPEEGIN